MAYIRLWLWRQVVRWYHFALRIEWRLSPWYYIKGRRSWYLAFHRYCVYLPLVLSFKLRPKTME